MNRLYKLGIIGLVVIFAYYEWLYVLRNAWLSFGDFGLFIAFQKAVFTGMFSSVLTWICVIPIAVKILKRANGGSEKGELYKRKVQ